MTARNGRGGPRSVEPAGRRPKDRGETEGQREGDGSHDRGHEYPGPGRTEAAELATADKDGGNDEGGGPDDHRGVQERVGGVEGGGPDTHDLECSAFLSLMMMVMFVIATLGMYEQLPGRAYLVWAGGGYAIGFVLGFLLGRQGPDSDRPSSRGGAAFECRMAVLLTAGGLAFSGFLGSGEEPWGGWEPPLLWVPAILLPAIGVGGGFDGALLGGIAGGLPRRTPWHALRFIVSERRRAAAENGAAGGAGELPGPGDGTQRRIER